MIVYELQPYFKDRTDAGQKLGDELRKMHLVNPAVLAIPRGGVPVSVEVAIALDAPLDVIVTRKIQIPQNPEAGYGAVTEDGEIVLNKALVFQLGLTDSQIQKQADQVRKEIARRGSVFRNILAPVSLNDRTAILIDDGLASGYTMLAAIKSCRRRGALKTIVAVPASSESACSLVRSEADSVVSLYVARTRYFAVASFYVNWYDLDDDEVLYHIGEWHKRRDQQQENRTRLTG